MLKKSFLIYYLDVLGIWIENSVSQLIYLFQQLLGGYKTRDQAIKKCITLVSENAKQLREKNEKNPDDFQVMKDLRKEQTKVRIMCTRSRESITGCLPCKWSALLCWTLSGPKYPSLSARIVVFHSWERHMTLTILFSSGLLRRKHFRCRT